MSVKGLGGGGYLRVKIVCTRNRVVQRRHSADFRPH